MQDWLLLQSGIVTYVALFLLLMGGAIGLPIPEDIPLILAGILVHRGQADLQLIFVICYVGILLGDIIIYFVGRRIGPAIFNKPWVRARMSDSKIKWVRLRLEKRSLVTIFIARHLFYLRTVTFLTCGAVRMHFTRFLLADAVAALVSAPIMIAIGYLGSERYEEIVHFLRQVKYLSVVLGILALCVGIYIYRRKKQAAAKEKAAEGKDTAATRKEA